MLESNSVSLTKAVIVAVTAAAGAIPDYEPSVEVAEYAVDKLRCVAPCADSGYESCL